MCSVGPAQVWTALPVLVGSHMPQYNRTIKQLPGTVDTCMIFSAVIACSWEFLVCHGYLLLGDATDMLLRAVASCVGGTNLLGDATDMRRFTSSMELAV
jgi:hypothetical protein